jgi:hypothetical protein
MPTSLDSCPWKKDQEDLTDVSAKNYSTRTYTGTIFDRELGPVCSIFIENSHVSPGYLGDIGIP